MTYTIGRGMLEFTFEILGGDYGFLGFFYWNRQNARNHYEFIRESIGSFFQFIRF